jgi:hypothetical protein
MSEPDVSQFESAKEAPTVAAVSMADFPPHLKDPANYDKIRRFLLSTLATRHSHGDALEWAGCFDCQRKFEKHKLAMAEIGFKSSAHYFAWQRIHHKIQDMQKVGKYYNE